MAEEVKFDEQQQALVDKLVGEARVKARDKAQAELTAQAAKEQDAAIQAALIAEKKWQELAQKHEARVKELEPYEAKAKSFDELVDSMLKDKVKTLGEAAQKAVKALPESMAAIDKLNWLNQNEELFQVAGDGVGTPRRPQPKSVKGKPAGPISRYPIKL